MKKLGFVLLLSCVFAWPVQAMQNRYSPLNKVAAAGDTAAVKKLLAQGTDVNATDKMGVTALMKAAQAGQLEAVKALLAAGANVDMQNYEGETALLYAAKEGHSKVVAALLKADADPALTDRAGNTPVFWAAANGHSDIIKQIVKADEKFIDTVDDENDYGITPLMAAVYNEQPLEVIQTLLNTRNGGIANTDEDGDNLGTWIARNGKLDYLKLLAKDGFRFELEDKNGIKPLMYALENGHTEVADFLMQEGCAIDPTSPNAQAVFVKALQQPYNTVVLQALNGKVDLNKLDKNGNAPLIKAVEQGNAQLVEDLLYYGADPNVRSTQRQTPLYAAITKGTPEMVKMLLDAGANPNAEVRESTPLMAAHKKKNAQMVNLLKQAGAVERETSLTTQLFDAVRDNDLQRTKELLQQGADPNSRANNDRGTTVFETTRQRGYEEMQKTLLAAGVDPTIHLIGEENIDTIEMLIKAGADVNYRDAEGWTPLLKACSIKYDWQAPRHAAIIKMLVDAGADVNAQKEGSLGDAPHQIVRGYFSVRGKTRAIKESNPTQEERMEAAGYTFNTPLILWAARGNAEGAETLLNAGAQVNMENVKGHTALHVAMDNANTEVEKVLREHHGLMHTPQFYKR